MVVRDVPIQSAATLGRADFGISDLERLPHFPPLKVCGCYFNDITKTFKDGRAPPPPRCKARLQRDEQVCRGCRQKGGGVNNHLKYLRQSYQNVPEKKQHVHCE